MIAQPPAAGPILDFHARLTPGPTAVDRLVDAMDTAGVTCAGLSAGGVVSLEDLARQVSVGGHVTAEADNAAVLDACRRYPDRLRPVYFANPHGDVKAYGRAAGGFAGLEISPAVHGLRFDDRSTKDLVAVAAEHRHFVYAVCLARPGAGVGDLVSLAVAFPEVNFVLGHGGVSLIDVHGLGLIQPHRNILVETCGPYAAVIRSAVERLGAERLLFSGEHPLQPPAAEFPKFAHIGLTKNEWRQIAWSNGRRLFGME